MPSQSFIESVDRIKIIPEKIILSTCNIVVQAIDMAIVTVKNVPHVGLVPLLVVCSNK